MAGKYAVRRRRVRTAHIEPSTEVLVLRSVLAISIVGRPNEHLIRFALAWMSFKAEGIRRRVHHLMVLACPTCEIHSTGENRRN